MKSSTSTNLDAFEKATEAAQKAGAACPEAVAEYLKDKMTVVSTMAGSQVMVRNGLEVETLDAAMARLQATEDVGALFHGGKVDVRTMSHDLFCAIRRHNPELVGLRKTRRFT